MKHDQPIPIAFAEARRALCDMFIDLSLQFHATTVPLDQEPGEIDANLTLVNVCVMLGHAAGKPMNASQIATRLRMPRTTVMRRLAMLEERGAIKKVKTRYFLEPYRAQHVPMRNTFELILWRGYEVLAPVLSKMDT